MQIAEHLATAIDTWSRRTTDKTRDLKVDARLAPAAMINAREKQIGSVLSSVPAGLMGCLHKAIAAAGSDPNLVELDPLGEQLLSSHDALCKGLLQLPAPQLLKLGKEHATSITQSRTRLKRLAREGRVQLQQRLQQQASKQRKASEERRSELRQVHVERRLSERQLSLRARRIWIAMLLLILAMMAVILLRR